MTLDSPLSLVKTVFLFDRLCSQLDLCWVPLLAHPNSLWCLQSKQDILHPSLNFQPDVSSIAGRWVCWDCLILRQKNTHTHTHATTFAARLLQMYQDFCLDDLIIPACFHSKIACFSRVARLQLISKALELVDEEVDFMAQELFVLYQEMSSISTMHLALNGTVYGQSWRAQRF